MCSGLSCQAKIQGQGSAVPAGRASGGSRIPERLQAPSFASGSPCLQMGVLSGLRSLCPLSWRTSQGRHSPPSR